MFILYVKTFAKTCLETSATKWRAVAAVFVSSICTEVVAIFKNKILTLKEDWLSFSVTLTVKMPCVAWVRL